MPGWGVTLTRLGKLAELHESSGALSEAIATLAPVVALDPAHEAAHRDLMRFYAQRR